MKTEHDKEIESFFAQLKEKDNEIQIPDFPKAKRQRSVNWWIPFGIAASLAIGFWFANNRPEETNLENDLVIIRLVEDENKEQKFIIETASSIDVWESPTSSLLTDY